MADDQNMPAMADNEYGDGMDSPKEPDAKPDDANGKDDGEQEAILPTAILQGKDFKVGDEVVLQITAMHDGQISVKYAPPKGKDDGGEEPEKAAVPAGMDGGDTDY
jgi:hypothetical protein